MPSPYPFVTSDECFMLGSFTALVKRLIGVMVYRRQTLYFTTIYEYPEKLARLACGSRLSHWLAGFLKCPGADSTAPEESARANEI